MDGIMDRIATIGVAIIGVATLAVLVSKKAATPQVIASAGNAFTSALAVAVSPVTGSSGGGLGGNGFVGPF